MTSVLVPGKKSCLMRLEGRATGWFTSSFELILDGTVLGVVTGEWFRENLHLPLSDRSIKLIRPSWLKSRYVLTDDLGTELGSATLVGFFLTHWEMELKCGPAVLERAGWFVRGYVLRQGTRILATVGPVNWWSRNWEVSADDTLSRIDVLLLGLMYVTIRKRESRRQSSQ
ncbi:hypothetical protein [Schlesneria sp.]|uniref:hypothetical protein n=1 Tax=Schlesneria sp. TaxID=2762018 RepID=UPI002EFB6872